MSIFSELDRLYPQWGSKAKKQTGTGGGAILIDSPERALSVLTQRIEPTKARRLDDFYTFVSGPLIAINEPNLNGAFWLSEDVKQARESLDLGPLNWLHEESTVIGAIRYSYKMRESVETTAVIWNWLNQDKIQELYDAVAKDRAYFSMECVAEMIEFFDGEESKGIYNYLKVMDRDPSVPSELHDRQRYTRRLINPTFLGAAVIVPPVLPGWPGAKLSINDQNEYASLANEDEAIAKRIMAFVQTGK